MNVYIVIEHAEGFGGTAKDLNDIVHGIFFDKRRAEDFVSGMMSYISSYEGQKLVLADGQVRDENYTIWFQVLEREIL